MHKTVSKDKRTTMPLRTIAITAVVTLLLAGAVSRWFGNRSAPAQQEGAAKARKIAYWRAPMNPAEIYDKPGKSAMGMDLVPVYEDELAGGVDIRIDPVVQQNMGLRTAPVTRQALVHTIRTTDR